MAKRRSKIRVGPKPTSPRLVNDSRAHDSSIVVLFADIVGCSEVSNHKNLRDYNDFLADFQRIFREVCYQHRDSWYAEHEYDYFQVSGRGDEGVLMLFVPDRRPPDLAKDVDTTINIALDLKRRWLLCDDNAARIRKSGLLPTDLGIGIHLGKAYINHNASGTERFRPEGYAINLTKRIESESRRGQFTHILVSEAAHEQLEFLADEVTYTFAPAHVFQPKGISRDIYAFEVRHHFLPTDWADVEADYKKTRASHFDPSEKERGIARQAYQENPTNLWLAEEYVMLEMQNQYSKLVSSGREDDLKATRAAFKDAEGVCRRLAGGEHRDEGTLVLRGFVAGESKRYVEEQRCYDEALSLKKIPNYVEASWYKAYSISAQLRDNLLSEGVTDETPYAELPDGVKESTGARIDEIIRLLDDALDIAPGKSWIRYDLACELSRWQRTARESQQAVRELLHAMSLNPAVARSVAEEPYLKPIVGNPKVAARITAVLDAMN